LGDAEKKLFGSMERFHSLSHFRYDRLLSCISFSFVFSFSKEELLSYLPSVKEKVGVKENMVLNKNLKKFLDKKIHSSKLQDQVRILEVFESVLPDIRKMYKEKLDERDVIDEFEAENISSGVKIEDGVFFDKYFLPSCIVLIYQSWLKIDLDEETMYHELFTIGAGSMNMSLLPEVTAICEKCADEMFLGCKSKTQTEIRQMNIQIFKKQSALKFVIPESGKGLDALGDSDGESDDERVHCNPFDSDEQVSSPKSEVSNTAHVNPFDDSEADSENTDVFLDGCDICCESFPSSQFVELHKSIFHAGPAVKTKFVDNPECLITTFIASPASPLDDSVAKPAFGTPSSSNQDPGGNEPECAVKDVAEGSSRRVTKYSLRKRLKYSC
jgi:hypothetical protein